MGFIPFPMYSFGETPLKMYSLSLGQNVLNWVLMRPKIKMQKIVFCLVANEKEPDLVEQGIISGKWTVVAVTNLLQEIDKEYHGIR